MTPEEVLDVFFDCMEQRHWSTATIDIDAARERTLKILNKRLDDSVLLYPGELIPGFNAPDPRDES